MQRLFKRLTFTVPPEIVVCNLVISSVVSLSRPRSAHPTLISICPVYSSTTGVADTRSLALGESVGCCHSLTAFDVCVLITRPCVRAVCQIVKANTIIKHARRYASAGKARKSSVHPLIAIATCPSVRPSHAGIV